MKKLLRLFRREKRERDLDAELQSYLDGLIEEKRRAGMPPEEALRAARMEFGGLAQVKESVRESEFGAWIDPLVQDLRYGARTLLRSPGFTAATILTLALGIGANTALFSVTRAFLLRDLPYRDPDRLMSVYEIWPHEPPFGESGARAVSPDWVNWRAHGRLVGGLEAYGGSNSVNLTGSGEPERVTSTRITAGFLGLLGIQPALGRGFTGQEDQLGGPPAAILSYALWQRRFGGSPAVIGKAVALDGVSTTIVGVLPATFVFPDNTVAAEILMPLALPANHDWHDEAHLRILHVLARLKPGVSSAALESEFATIVRSTAAEEPRQIVTMRQGMRIAVSPLRKRLVGDIQLVLWILEAAVGMVLLVGCLNIAGLQVARALSRQREMALRTALGAGRSRLVRQLLTESLLVGCVGAAVGFLLGVGALRYVRGLLPANLHLAPTVRIDGAVLAFTVTLAVLCGLLTGLVPALAFSEARLEEVLKLGSSRTSESKRQHKIRDLLVVAEIAVAMVLLAGAGLLTRSFLRLASADLGFDPHGLVTMSIPLQGRKYSQPDAQTAFYHRLLEGAKAIPGAQAAVWGAGSLLGVVIEGRPAPPPGGAPDVAATPVSPEYFPVFRIPLLRGRSFGAADRSGAPLVLIVNQAFADEFFPGQDALGQHVRFGSVRQSPWREIVGIAGNVRRQALEKPDVPHLYVPYPQMPDSLSLVLRSNLAPAALATDARRVVQGIDPDQPVADVATMESIIHEALGGQRASMILMGALAGLALTLAAVGIFGVIAYLVSRRAHEIGIRLALGARPADVCKLVLGHAMILTTAGIGAGLGGALVATRALRNLLHGTQANDPVALAAAVALFFAVAIAACYVPVRRASRLDPAVTLHHE